MLKKEHKEVIIFFIITIFLSLFVFWGPIAIFKIPTVNLVEGAAGPAWAIMLFIIGGFVPSITGIILTAVFEGKKGTKQLLKQAFKINIGFKWFNTIILISVYFTVSLIIIYSVLGGNFDYSQFLIQLPTIFPLIILGPLSEEYGWRGFALKRLLKIVHPNLASLVVGLIWSLWHLPLFYMAGTSQHEFNIPFLAFLISITSCSFIYTYIYIKTNGNLFSAVLFHWIYTYVIQVVSTTIVRSDLYNWLEFVPALLLGIVFGFMLNKEKKAECR